VKAVYFNDTPIPDKLVYLFLGERRSARDRQNLTTDSNGIATFSLNTTNHNDKIQLR
ncbi:alpha-2-macroglobulin-like, partial [Scomber scombrus]